MRGSRAKNLRGLAGVQKEERDSRSYDYIKHTLRKRSHNNVLGEPAGAVMTATLVLDPAKQSGARAMYKLLKHNHKAHSLRTAW